MKCPTTTTKKITTGIYIEPHWTGLKFENFEGGKSSKLCTVCVILHEIEICTQRKKPSLLSYLGILIYLSAGSLAKMLPRQMLCAKITLFL